MSGIGRGTTPYNIFRVSLDMRDAETVWLTYKQGSRIVVDRQKEDLEITETIVTAHLTQNETLAMKTTLPMEIQFRCNIGGEAFISKVIETTVDKILKEGVI